MKTSVKFDFEHYHPAIPAIPAIPEVENSRIAKIAAIEATKPAVENSRIAELAADVENNSVEWVEYIEPEASNPLTVICYTPAGKPILVGIRDEEHKAFLLRMNPAPKQLNTDKAIKEQQHGI